jgi:hypothetical protein
VGHALTDDDEEADAMPGAIEKHFLQSHRLNEIGLPRSSDPIHASEVYVYLRLALLPLYVYL